MSEGTSTDPVRGQPCVRRKRAGGEDREARLALYRMAASLPPQAGCGEKRAVRGLPHLRIARDGGRAMPATNSATRLLGIPVLHPQNGVDDKQKDKQNLQ